MVKYIFPAIILVVLMAGISFWANKKSHPENQVAAQSTISPEPQATDAPLVKFVYADYSANDVANWQGFPLLFFTSKNCVACQAEEADIKKNAALVPAGVKIFEVDYDSNAELVQKYQVSAPDTWVQIKSDGTVVSSWMGGGQGGIDSHLKAF